MLQQLAKKTMAFAVSLGVVMASVPMQVAYAASENVSIDMDKYSSTFKFSTQELAEIEYRLTRDKDNVTVDLNVPGTSKQIQDMSNITVPKSTLQAIEKSGKTLTVEVYSEDTEMEYAWILNSGKMDKLADLNLALKITNISTLKPTDAVTVNSAAVQMKHTTEVPKNTELIIPVREGDKEDEKDSYPVFYYDIDYAKDSSYYLYKMSGSKMSHVTSTRYKLSKDKKNDDRYKFRIDIATGGTYVLTPTNLNLSGSGSTNNGGSSSDSVQLSAYSGTVGVGGTASILVQKPTTGTFTVTSGNPGVAQVVGSGSKVSGGTQYQVQGLAPGISVITVTSSNGTSSSYTMVVQQTAGWVMIDTLSYQFAPGAIYDYKVTLQGAAASEVNTYSSRPHIASVKEQKRVDKGNGQVEVYYRITAHRASADPVTVISSVKGVHSSIRVMVTAGIKGSGVSARNQSFFTS